METTAQVQPTKVATMKYRKNSIEEDDKEIEELEKARAGEEEKEEVEQEPEHPEERTFKKRYGDLRRHLQKKEDEHRKELLTIREQLSNLTKTQVRLPKGIFRLTLFKLFPEAPVISKNLPFFANLLFLGISILNLFDRYFPVILSLF